MAAKPYYITTPIYYPSGNPHIGHCYTTVACDSIARYRRMQGYDVMFLTGTDEHGLKIEQKAAEKGVTPKEYVDEIVKTFKSLWSYMNISYDRYIRTTDDYHIETVQKIFKELYDKGYIYKGKYQGKPEQPNSSTTSSSRVWKTSAFPEPLSLGAFRLPSTRSTLSMFGLTLCQTISLHWASITMLTTIMTVSGQQMCTWLQRILCDSMQSFGLRS